MFEMESLDELNEIVIADYEQYTLTDSNTSPVLIGSLQSETEVQEVEGSNILNEEAIEENNILNEEAVVSVDNEDSLAVDELESPVEIILQEENTSSWLDPGRLRSHAVPTENENETNSMLLQKISNATRRLKLLMKAKKTQFKKGFNSYADALRTDNRWHEAYKKELQKLEERGGLTIVKRTEEMDCIPFREVLTQKLDNITGKEVLKVRLAARGDMQKDKPETTYSPTVAYEELRTMLVVLKCTHCFVMQGDCPSAYLNATLDEPVFLLLPQGHPLKEKKDVVYKCPSALYGLAIAGRAWYLKFVKILAKFGLKPSRRSPCLFYFERDGKILWLQLYVDDFIYGSTCEELMTEFGNFLEKELQVKSTDDIKKFVGVELKFDNSNLFIHQNSMIQRLIQEYRISTTFTTPMIQNLRWTENSIPLDNIRPLQQLLGELSYIGHLTRPDICYAVNRIARVTHKATKETYRAAKRILSYLAANPNYFIQINEWPENEDWQMDVFCDSSYADNKSEKFKSTGGHVIYLNSTPVAWKSKRMKWICCSTAEAEYLSCYSAVKSAMKIAFDVEEVYKRSIWPLVIHVDSLPVIQTIQKSTSNDMTKHMALKFFKLQEWYEEGYIWFVHVPSKDNISDIFTKPLGYTLFDKFRNMILTVWRSVETCVASDNKRVTSELDGLENK